MCVALVWLCKLEYSEEFAHISYVHQLNCLDPFGLSLFTELIFQLPLLYGVVVHKLMYGQGQNAASARSFLADVFNTHSSRWIWPAKVESSIVASCMYVQSCTEALNVVVCCWPAFIYRRPTNDRA